MISLSSLVINYLHWHLKSGSSHEFGLKFSLHHAHPYIPCYPRRPGPETVQGKFITELYSFFNHSDSEILCPRIKIQKNDLWGYVILSLVGIIFCDFSCPSLDGVCYCWISNLSSKFWQYSRHFHSLSTPFLPFLSFFSFYSLYFCICLPNGPWTPWRCLSYFCFPSTYSRVYIQQSLNVIAQIIY